MTPRSVELTVASRNSGTECTVDSVKRDSDDPQDSPRNSTWVHKTPQWRADGSTASVLDTKLQLFAHVPAKYGSFSSTDCSPFKMPVFGKLTAPLIAGCPGGVMSPLNTPVSELTSAHGQLKHIPRTFQQTRVVSGRTSASTVNPKLEFGTSSSVFSSPGHHANTPERHGTRRDRHLVESNTLASIPNAKPFHFETARISVGGVAFPSFSTKIPTAPRSFMEPPDIAFCSTCDTAYLQSTCSPMASSSNDSSLVTSFTVETCPGIIKTPHLASKIQNNQDSASPTLVSASVRNPEASRENMADDCGETATVFP